MADPVFTVQTRPSTGTGAARAVRREGRIPGVIYGGKDDAASVAFDRKEVFKAFAKGKFLSHLIEIDHDGKRLTVLPRAVQFDPVSDEPLHIDLYRVDENTRIDVEVPVRFENAEASPGLKRGGVLNIVRHTVSLNTPAGKIPEELVVDLTGKTIGESIHISSIALPEGVRPTIRGRDFTVATIAGRMAEVAEDAAPVSAEVPTVADEKKAAEEGSE